MKKILILGFNSFAAQGVCVLLRAVGHDVTCFGRGNIEKHDNVITGSVYDLVNNPYLKDFDIVINYIVLKDTGVDENIRFIDSLLEFCKNRAVKQLIHFSSISSYSGKTKKVFEDSPIETIPSRKGSYGSLKVCADLRLAEKRPPQLKIVYVRPGFILGRGVISPIIGMGFRFGKNGLFQIGSKQNILPITTRELVSKAILKLCQIDQIEDEKVVMIVDPNSPTRYTWLTECCTRMGVGTYVFTLPVWFWKIAGCGGEIIMRILRVKISPWTIVQNACREMKFYPQRSEEYLGFDFSCDWKKELVNSFENQDSYDFRALITKQKYCSIKNIKDVLFIGYGGIVKQRHLDALYKINYTGNILAFDVIARMDNKQEVRTIDQFSGGDASALTIVATPGNIHSLAIPLLRKVDGPIIVEKPLCFSREEYATWLGFADQRNAPVVVCHNYRFKRNMRAFYQHLAMYSPGKLLNVHLEFQSPPVSMDNAGWRKKERDAKTLLMDYALHFLDIACMFHTSRWDVKSVQYTLNTNKETSLISGLLRSIDYDVTFLLRQGFQPRRCHLFFTFQNYGVSLGFFPDTFVPYMTDSSSGVYNLETIQTRSAVIEKIGDKLLHRNADDSHAYLFGLSCQKVFATDTVSVSSLRAFYDCIFDIAQEVYGS